MFCINAMSRFCLLSLIAAALAVDMSACGNQETCETQQTHVPVHDELESEDFGVQFVQKRTESKRMQAVPISRGNQIHKAPTSRANFIKKDEKDPFGDSIQALMMGLNKQADEYELVGEGSCQDVTGSHGTDYLEFIESKNESDPHTNCQKWCSENQNCTGYDDREEGCVFYRIAISESSKSTALYKCYKKVKANGKEVNSSTIAILDLNGSEVVVPAEERKDAAELNETEAEKCIRFRINPAESLRSYSSVLNDSAPGTGNAQSQLQVKAAWLSKVDEPGEYMIMDMGQETSIKGVITQARGNKSYNYVTEFAVQTSLDGKQWSNVSGTFENTPEGFTENFFPGETKTRYMKLVVVDWNAKIAMRAGAILCEPPDTLLKRIAVPPGLKAPDPSTCSWIVMNPPEKQRTYSSVYWDDGPGFGNAESMLDSPQAWTAKNNEADEYMIIDLGAITFIRGVLTQCRMDKPTHYVKKYAVAYSSDGAKWTDVGGPLLRSKKAYTRSIEGTFPSLIAARYVKLIVKEWRNTISMRAGAVVCAPTSST